MSQIRPPSFAHYQEPHKRKRTRSVSSRPSSSAGFLSSSPGPAPSDIINPLSYTPTVLSQLHLAGHSDADLLPSTAIPDFPHRPLPREKILRGQSPSSSPAETNDDDDEGREKDAKRRQNAEHAHRVAERHLGVLTALIHRSLEECDIARAKRAFGLLVRSEIWGASVDLRKNGYWALGAEILMREGERPPSSSGDEAVGEEEDDATRSEDGVIDKEETIPCRWGRASNMPAVRDYFRSLISQYPWNRFQPRSMSALSFWPALLGCELYNTWIEQVRALKRLDIEAEDWSLADTNEEGGHDGSGGSGDSAYLKVERRKREARDAIRLEALHQMRDVARSMDDLMIAPPFSTSHELLRLRGMIALYMADLVVPPRPRTEGEEHEAKVQRGTEMDRARHRFRKIIDDGGEVERWVRDFVSRSTDDTDEDEDDDRSSNIDLPFFSSLPIRGR
ncbi:hypothetical protein PpBr36_02853 [Pyricularia pennisetigena]|uniref:hypothetical protein n=1 Tax=Pyricularia pennisetigena TaxID=1578925 RepID=UPI001153D453|nr:hypothetical protein PpBr36_02853 [Pyricularia pennisetigena]TLS30825.1 hypothetical protein PpBr36_02853 [Pyricularia pennisetigena]